VRWAFTADPRSATSRLGNLVHRELRDFQYGLSAAAPLTNRRHASSGRWSSSSCRSGSLCTHS